MQAMDAFSAPEDTAIERPKAASLRRLEPAGLKEFQMRAVMSRSRRLEVRRPHRIYSCGDPSEHVFLVGAGVVKLVTIAQSNREIVLGFLQRGALFGESALLDGSPRDHSAHAHEDVVVYAMHRESLLRLVHESADFGYELARLMALGIRRVRARLEPLLYRTAHARVAHALLALADEHGVADANGVLIPLRLTQTELATLAGVTRETVNLVLSDLRGRGLLEVGRHSIRLRRPDGLRLTTEGAEEPCRAAAQDDRTLTPCSRVAPRPDEPALASRSAGADRR
jgi:CRP/FNR family transcriptional regulator